MVDNLVHNQIMMEEQVKMHRERSVMKGDLGTSIGVTQKSQMAYDSFAMFDNNSVHSQFDSKEQALQLPLDQTMKVSTQAYNTI